MHSDLYEFLYILNALFRLKKVIFYVEEKSYFRWENNKKHIFYVEIVLLNYLY